MGGWLSPCTAVTTYNLISSSNKAIWARRTKFTGLPTHTIIKTKNYY